MLSEILLFPYPLQASFSLPLAVDYVAMRLNALPLARQDLCYALTA
jgi:hypothetical protein